MKWTLFVLGAVLSWGIYGPMLHRGQTLLGNPLRALLCVGIAYVMALVFGGAPLVNVVVSAMMHPPKQAPSPMLYAGYLLAAVGAGLVLRYRPT